MATRTSVPERTPGTEAPAQNLQTQTPEVVVRPPVNIYEDADGITLEADIPGVSKERLNVRVDGNTLLIEGEIKLDLSPNMEALYADVRSTHYRRSFALSRELETGGIEAKVKDGVLTVRIPKRAELRPRKIEVQ
jgi:HSP20 family protein